MDRQHGPMCAAGSMTSGCPRIESSRSPPRAGAIIPIRQMDRKLSTGSWNGPRSAMRKPPQRPTAKKAKRQRKGEVRPPLSDDEKAAFYARMVNADGYLPQSVISNTIRDAMLVRGLVTPERLRQRGVR